MRALMISIVTPAFNHEALIVNAQRHRAMLSFGVARRGRGSAERCTVSRMSHLSRCERFGDTDRSR